MYVFVSNFCTHLAFLYVYDDWSYLWPTTYHLTLYNSPESAQTPSDAVLLCKWLLCFARSLSPFRARFRDFCDEWEIPVIDLNSINWKLTQYHCSYVILTEGFVVRKIWRFLSQLRIGWFTALFRNICKSFIRSMINSFE